MLIQLSTGTLLCDSVCLIIVQAFFVLVDSRELSITFRECIVADYSGRQLRQGKKIEKEDANEIN